MKDLDKKIKQSLTLKAEETPISLFHMEKVKKSIKIKEEITMKKSFKRVALATAALCTLTAITAIAGGKFSSIISHSSHADKITNFSEVSELAEKVDKELKYIEEFENGYKFDYATPSYAYTDDSETGKKSDEWIEAHIAYEKKGEAPVSLNATKTYFDNGSFDNSEEYNDITLKYSSNDYLFLPPDTEISEEDLALMEAGELYISYGSAKEERKVIENVTWTEDDIYYTLMTMDGNLGEDGLMEMAKEIIDAE